MHSFKEILALRPATVHVLQYRKYGGRLKGKQAIFSLPRQKSICIDQDTCFYSCPRARPICHHAVMVAHILSDAVSAHVGVIYYGETEIYSCNQENCPRPHSGPRAAVNSSVLSRVDQQGHRDTTSRQSQCCHNVVAIEGKLVMWRLRLQLPSSAERSLKLSFPRSYDFDHDFPDSCNVVAIQVNWLCVLNHHHLPTDQDFKDVEFPVSKFGPFKHTY